MGGGKSLGIFFVFRIFLLLCAGGLAISDNLTSNEHAATEEANHRSKPSYFSTALDSAYVRSKAEHQCRNFVVVVGSIESKGGEKRRLGLSVICASNPGECLRRNLVAAGWRVGNAVTVLSVGDPELSRLMRGAITGKHS